jgi:hydrogenase nickel incorporation protein HypA/HybF
VHELSIATSILELVQAEASAHAGASPHKIGVRIGELAAVNPEALQFSFDVMKRDAGLESLVLEIETCPLRYSCVDCHMEFAVRNCDFRCPRCSGLRNQCISGDQLELAYLELEEHEASNA